MPDTSAKEGARERLLQAKANLRELRSLGQATDRSETESSEVQNQAAEMKTSFKTPLPAAPVPHEEPSPPPAAQEDGFLAELGRADEQERK